jgi:Tfp pilus assembly protein PilF
MMSARAYIERYFGSAGKTLDGLQLAIKIETALQTYDLVEQYQLELTRSFPFSEAAEKIKHNY